MSGGARTAEELLRETEALRDTLRNLDDGYYSVSADGVILEHNRAFNRILGLDAGRDMRGRKSPDFWRVADDRQVYLQELMARGSVQNFEANARRIDGSELFVLLSAHLVKDEGGHLVRIEGTVRDITERKRMEEELRRAFEELGHEKRLTDTIVDSMPGIFYTLDFTGRFVRWNSNFERVTGYGGEELAAMNALELFEGEDKQRIAGGILEVAEKGEATVEAEITNKAGRRTPYLFTGMRAEIGGAPHLIGMGIDITDRKRAEAELHIKNQVFEDSIASQSVADRSGVITHVNPAFLRLWGYAAKEEAIGKSVGSFFADPADATPVLAALAAHDAWEGRFRARRTDGSTFVSHGYATTLRNAAGELTGYQSTNLDVTPLVEAERQLEALNVNLARSNQELEQFAYVASHDLQEPLRMVSSFTQLLAQRYADKLDDDAREFIGFAVDGANRMQRLIQDLLEYSRVTTRGRTPSPLDAHDALGEAVSNLQIAIQEAGALVSNDELPRIVGDRTQVAQVFQNLVGNAIKFRKPGEPPRVHVSAEQSATQPGFWSFAVRDNGIGIEPRHFERLFVIFQRLHGKREYPGTGIGLALCKRIVERHGGKIRLESEAGVGTTVFFTLPAAQSGKGAE